MNRLNLILSFYAFELAFRIVSLVNMSNFILNEIGIMILNRSERELAYYFEPEMAYYFVLEGAWFQLNATFVVGAQAFASLCLQGDASGRKTGQRTHRPLPKQFDAGEICQEVVSTSKGLTALLQNTR
jgi:hypothetical protein